MNHVTQLDKNAEFARILRKLGKSPGYSQIKLTPNGACVVSKKRSTINAGYLALFETGGKRCFLGASSAANSIGLEDADEIKKAIVLIRSTEKGETAFIHADRELEAPEPDYNDPKAADAFELLTPAEGGPSFFFLVTFDEENRLTGLYVYGNFAFPVDMYAYTLVGNPPLSELRDFFSLLFAILTKDMPERERYWNFLREMMGEEDDER